VASSFAHFSRGDVLQPRFRLKPNLRCLAFPPSNHIPLLAAITTEFSIFSLSGSQTPSWVPFSAIFSPVQPFLSVADQKGAGDFFLPSRITFPPPPPPALAPKLVLHSSARRDRLP